MRNLITGLIVGAVLIFLAFIVLQQTGVLVANKATVSGSVNLNGVIPDGATLTIQQKEYAPNTTYETFAEGLKAKDGQTWSFDKAHAGTSYEIQANLVVNGNVVGQSNPLLVTAPATDEVLTLNIGSGKDGGGNATVSGNVGVNGYIPPGSTIAVEARKVGDPNFKVLVSDLPAKDNQFMSNATAVSGQSYEVRGFLYDANGDEIGASSTLVLTAPAENEQLDINSAAQPPAKPAPTASQPGQPTPTPQPATGAISGTINFNGQAPPNSRIVVFQRKSGTQNYQVAQDNISPQNGASWSFNGTVGQSYDTLAVLKQKQSNGTDTDISDSNTITVTAPAANEVFTINSGFSLPQPTGSISVNCGNINSGNLTWNATISFQSINGAASYWFQIGTTNGGTELANQTQNASNSQYQTLTQSLQNGVTYYARYAYSNVQNQAAYSSTFSPLSQTTQLRCSQ